MKTNSLKLFGRGMPHGYAYFRPRDDGLIDLIYRENHIATLPDGPNRDREAWLIIDLYEVEHNG